MANSISSSLGKNKEINCTSFRVTLDGSAGSAMVPSGCIIPANSLITNVYLNTDDGAAVGGSSPTIRLAVGGASSWITAALADPASGEQAITAANAQRTGQVYCTIGGTPAAGAYSVHICYVADTAPQA